MMRTPCLRGYLVAVLLALLLFAPADSPAEEQSLGEKIKQIFSTPTPSPSHHHRKHKRRSTPTPTPSPSPKSTKKHKSSPTPTPTPEEEKTPHPKRKKKASPSPSPTPTETPSPSPEETPTPSPSPASSPAAKVATVEPDEIRDYEKNPEQVRKLLDDSLALTKQHLDYTYGSADPENGGMDCSGFIYYVLHKNGVKDVPRSASEQYVWVRKAGTFRAVLSRDLNSFELDELKPGDLLFWTGTYEVERDPPVTHTMIYLGKEKESGKPIMVGSSDGRTYEGEKEFGVSVFDFKTAPASKGDDGARHPRFVGYARIPGLGSNPPD
jgi:cell wall-associated NlpC family hydrolase